MGLAKNLTAKDAVEKVDEHEEIFAKRGFKSLGVMVSDGIRARDLEDAKSVLGKVEKFNFVGVLALSDPPRDDMVQVIKDAHKLGVVVKMITGDHKAIAKYVLGAIGLNETVVKGQEYEDVGDGKEDSVTQRQKDLIL